LLWLRNLGCVILLFLAYQLWGTGLQQHRTQTHLAAQFNAALVAAHSASGGGPTGPPSSPARAPTVHPAVVSSPDLGQAIARLQIPKIGLDEFVVQGTSESDLRKGPGHYPGTPMPGQPGNSAIAGHRTTYGAPFNRLGDLKPGDEILATTTAGTFVYTVSTQPFSVIPSQTSVVDDYGDNRLTLTTCTPEFSATHRLIVVAALRGTLQPPSAVASAQPVVTPIAAAPRHRVAAVEVATPHGYTFAALPLAALWLAVLMGAAALYRPLLRRWPRVAVLAVLVPVWLSLLIPLFEQLTRVLPANV